MAARVLPASEERAGYLDDVRRLLWPPPARSEPGRGRSARASQAGTELIVLPGWRQPRLLVPAGRRAAAAAVRRYGEPGSRRARIATRMLAAALAAGLDGLVLRDRLRVHVPPGALTIESYLGAALDQPVLVSMHLGSARANRKPVLQLLTGGGDTVGFAKIGINPLTTRLVRAEHAALTRICAGPPAGVQVPRPLSLGSWQELEVLVLSPLPVWQRRRPLRAGQLTSAMAAVAAIGGLRQSRLAPSTYLCGLRQRLAATGNGAEQAALGDALRLLADGDGVLSFGASHGDWTPWNMASTASGLLVWDWERFTDDAPVGFDSLHYWLQSKVVDPRRDPAGTAADCVRLAAELLAPFGVRPAQARLTALCYLADLSVRYLADLQHEAGARLGAPGGWLIPVLTAEAGRQ